MHVVVGGRGGGGALAHQVAYKIFVLGYVAF